MFNRWIVTCVPDDKKKIGHKWVPLAHSKVHTKTKYRTHTLKISHDTFVFLSSGGVLSVVFLAPESCYTESVPTEPWVTDSRWPHPTARATRVERVYTCPAPSRARVNSTLAQQPEVNIPHLPYLSGCSNILLEIVTHTAHIWENAI